jgi:hypothetical protein
MKPFRVKPPEPIRAQAPTPTTPAPTPALGFHLNLQLADPLITIAMAVVLVLVLAHQWLADPLITVTIGRFRFLQKKRAAKKPSPATKPVHTNNQQQPKANLCQTTNQYQKWL